MAGLIPADAGQADPASAAAPAPQPGSAAPGGSPAPDQGDPLATNPAALIPANVKGQAVDGADQGGPRAKGTQADADAAAVDADPEAPVNATPEEQKQYDSLVSRFILFISDPRQATPQHASPNQSVIAQLNKPNVPLVIALGSTAANVMFMLMHSAKVQGKPYDAEIGYYAADEVIPALYELGQAHGVWKGTPPYQPPGPDGTLQMNDDEIKLMGEAKIQGIRFIGNLMLKAGWITPDVAQANVALWKQRIEQEEQHGNISNEVLEQLSQKGVFDKIHDQLGTTGFSGAGQPGASPSPSATLPTDPAAGASAPAADPTSAPAGAAGQSGGLMDAADPSQQGGP